MQATVYPRVCGGTTFPNMIALCNSGLSPRVRGNLEQALFVGKRRGSIPACAGEPPWPCGWRRRPGVYPRVCGGTMMNSDPAAAHKGLSPRVRGNRRKAARHIGPDRSIPACAGEPLTRAPSRFPRRVYPRVCGEPFSSHKWKCRKQVYPRVCGGTDMEHISIMSSEGLSPRVRGNHDGTVHIELAEGSIPACAGEPV